MIQLQKLAVSYFCLPMFLEAKLCNEQWQELQHFPHFRNGCDSL